MKVLDVGTESSVMLAAPAAQLAPFVSGYRIGTFADPCGANVVTVSPPAVTAELVFTAEPLVRSSLGDTSVHRPGAFVLGPLQAERSTSILPIPEGARVATVVFKPGAGPHFFRLLASEMLDLVLDVHDVLPAQSIRGIGQIMAARHHLEMKDALDRFLLRILPSLPAHGQRHMDLQMLESVLRGSTTLDLAQQSTLSERQITRRFRRAFGMTPSRIRRIVRFSRASESIVRDPDSSLASIAAAHGYADQAHMAREFRGIAGVAPSGYAGKRSSSIYLKQPQSPARTGDSTFGRG